MENKFTTLASEVKNLSKPLTFQELAVMIVRGILLLSGAASASFLLYNKQKRKFEDVQSSSDVLISSHVQIKALLKAMLHTEMPIAMSKQDLAILHEDTANMQSGLLIPVVYGRKTIAVIVIYYLNTVVFTPEQIEQIQVYSAAVGLAASRTQLQKELQIESEKRDAFITFVSHEIRNPLTSLNGYLELLFAKLAKQNTDEGRWVRELHFESIRLTKLVKELLTVDRARAN